MHCILNHSFAFLFTTDSYFIFVYKGPAQQLYVRLFQRKFTWFRTAKVEYPRIALNLKPLFTEMIDAGLMITGEFVRDTSVIFTDVVPHVQIDVDNKFLNMSD